MSKLEKIGQFRPFRPWKMTFRAIQSNPALGSWLPAIPVKAPTRKSAPGRVHGKNPQKCAHGPVFCTSEVTHAGSVPNNPPMGQLLGETMVSITCVIYTLTGTWRSSEGATFYFPKYSQWAHNVGSTLDQRQLPTLDQRCIMVGFESWINVRYQRCNNVRFQRCDNVRYQHCNNVRFQRCDNVRFQRYNNVRFQRCDNVRFQRYNNVRFQRGINPHRLNLWP